MGLTAEQFANTNPNFAEVTFEVMDGSLEITPRTITLTADDKRMVYGEMDPVLTAKVEGVAGNDVVTPILVLGEHKDVGTYPIQVSALANPNYEMQFTSGSLTIEPRPVTVYAEDKAKTYREEDPLLTGYVEGLLEGEDESLIRYTLARARGEQVGEYDIKPSGLENQGNYKVSYVPGKLTIVSLEGVIVRITGNSGTYLYDGAEKDAGGYTVEISNPEYTEADFTFTGSSELKATNAGSYVTGLSPEQFENINENFTDVVFLVTDGNLEITRRSLKLTSGSATKQYDGTPLTNTSVEITGDGFAEGEGMNIAVTGRRTEVGESDNTFTYAFDRNTLAENYTVETEFGKLTVEEAPEPEVTETPEPEETETPEPEVTETPEPEATETPEPEATATPEPQVTETPAPRPTATPEPSAEPEAETEPKPETVKHRLTINFMNLEGQLVSNDIVTELEAGEPYSIEVPPVEGYTPMITEVAGRMPGYNQSVTVFMVADVVEMTTEGVTTSSGQQFRYVDILNYGTPLGIENVTTAEGLLIE